MNTNKKIVDNRYYPVKKHLDVTSYAAANSTKNNTNIHLVVDTPNSQIDEKANTSNTTAFIVKLVAFTFIVGLFSAATFFVLKKYNMIDMRGNSTIASTEAAQNRKVANDIQEPQIIIDELALSIPPPLPAI